MKALLAHLPPAAAEEVSALWDALLTARRNCEAMAARGVRVSRDLSRDWQETVSDLIDRVVTQDQELTQLRQQVGRMATYEQVSVMYTRPVSSCQPCSQHRVLLA